MLPQLSLRTIRLAVSAAGIVLFCTHAFCTRASARPPDLRTLYQEARRAQVAGDAKTAIEKYEQILRLRPDLAEMHSNLGTLYYQQRQVDDAVKSFQTALKLKADLGAPNFFLGLIAFNARKHEVALRHLKKSEALDRSNLPTQLYLGYTYYAQSDFRSAARHLEKVAKLEPVNQDVFYHLSKAYGQLAKQFFGTLQKEFADSYHIHLARAHLYEAEGNWEKAELAYRRALQVQPANERLNQKLQAVAQKKSDPSVVSTVGTVPDDLVDGSTNFLYNPPPGKKIQELLELYKNRVRKLEKESAKSSETLFFLAEYHQALSYLASLWVAAANPDSYRAHLLRGQYYEDEGKDEEAIREYQRALELKPDLRNVHFAIGNLYWKKDQDDDALPELQGELQLDPNHPSALYEIAEIFYTRGRLDEAEKYYLRSLEYDPRMVEAYLGVERIFTSRDEYQKALEYLHKAVELDPENATPHYRMATIYRKMGDGTKARAALSLFQKLKKGDEQQ